jgi:hypothetical protein
VGFERCLFTIAVVLAAASPAPAQSPADDARFVRGFGPEVQEGFKRVRAVTAPFMTLDSAVVAGYVRDVPRCFADGHHGAMGFHHLNRAYVDARAEVEKPEILLYERHPDGRYALNGVEYIIPYTRWPRDSVPPTIMGQALKREDQLKLWYLHMWVWNENSAGLFADWNPSVKCPPDPK